MARILKAAKDKMRGRGYMTLPDAAKKVGVSYSCMWNWVTRDQLRDRKGRPTVKWMGAIWVRLAAVEKLVALPRGL